MDTPNGIVQVMQWIRTGSEKRKYVEGLIWQELE